MDREERIHFPKKVKKAQSLLAKYCLDERQGIPENIHFSNPSGLLHYRRLIHNIMEGCLENAFPIAYDFLQGDRWDDLVMKFTSECSCQSYQICHTPKEFYLFVRDRSSENPEDAFLVELLYFEWVEIELHVMPDVAPHPSSLSLEYTSRAAIIINPEYRLVTLKHPVHRVAPSKALNAPGSYHLLLFRCADTGDVQFIEINAVFVWIIQVLDQEPLSVCALVDRLLDTLSDQIKDADAFFEKIENFIKSLLQKKALRGFDL